MDDERRVLLASVHAIDTPEQRQIFEPERDMDCHGTLLEHHRR